MPLRGRPLRDRYVLRLIALDRVIHFLVLSGLAAAVILFANNKATLNDDFTRILKDLQGGLGGPVNNSPHGIVHDLQRLFAFSTTNLYLIGAGAAVYAALEGTEAVGLWLGRRWAEYLTFIATVVFVPYEVWELTKSISWLKILTLIINLAIVIYLLYAKRLFGLRGGGKAERAEREARHRLARDRAGHPALRRGWPCCGAATDGIPGPGPNVVRRRSLPGHRLDGAQWHPSLLAGGIAHPGPAAGSSCSIRVSSSPLVVASSVVS